MRFQGWTLTALAAAGLALMVGVAFASHATVDEALGAVIRWTARSSFVLFLAAFVAAALHAFRPGGATRWLLSNRRYVGASFALSHLLHAVAIFGRAGLSGGVFSAGRTAAESVPGGVVYLFIVFMLATSFDRGAACVGRRVWTVGHTVGSYLIFGSFLSAYGVRAVESPWYLPQVTLLLAVLGLRLWKRWQKR